MLWRSGQLVLVLLLEHLGQFFVISSSFAWEMKAAVSKIQTTSLLDNKPLILTAERLQPSIEDSVSDLVAGKYV